MNGNDFFGLSLAVQAALGAGYLGYVTAYAGFRKDHGIDDTFFISMAFASAAFLTFGILEARVSVLVAFVGAFAASLALACLWRVWGREWWQGQMQDLNVHRDDGVHTAWTCLVQSKASVGQVSVHLKNGRVLYLNNRPLFHGSPYDGLYLGGDGSVILAVEEEETPEGVEEVREDIRDDDWGTRLTYVPAGEIARVNIRMK